MVTEDRLDESLKTLGDDVPGPTMSAELEGMLDKIEGVRTRSPKREAFAIAFISMLYSGGMIFLWNLRGDWDTLPFGWVLAFAGGWLIGFITLLWLALVPQPGLMSPRWRFAAVATAVTGIAFPVAGLLLARAGSASVLSDVSIDSFLGYSNKCVRLGLVTAAVPIILATLVLRRAIPVRGTAVAAALGAGGGALGGFTLHMHCHVADRAHVGLVHGGLVLICAAVAMLVVPRFLAPR